MELASTVSPAIVALARARSALWTASGNLPSAAWVAASVSNMAAVGADTAFPLPLLNAAFEDFGPSGEHLRHADAYELALIREFRPQIADQEDNAA